MKLTKEQVELLSIYTAAKDLGYSKNDLDTTDVKSLRYSVESSPIYMELFNIAQECPIEVESPYWVDYFESKNVNDLTIDEKSILNI